MVKLQRKFHNNNNNEFLNFGSKEQQINRGRSIDNNAWRSM